jgi:hypothetical protein
MGMHMRSSLILAVALLICATNIGNGTSFYFVHSGDAIYIAGDTFISTQYPNLKTEPGCKIVVSPNYVAVLTGELGVVHGSRSTDHLTQSSSLAGNVAAILRQPGGSSKTKMDQLIEALKTSIYQDYASLVISGNRPNLATTSAGVGLFWFEGKRAMTKGVMVNAHLGKKIEFQVNPSPVFELPPNQVGALAHQEALQAPNPPSLSEIMFTPDKALDKLLTTQSQMTPKLVQPPFTMYRFSPTHSRWIENGDICQPIHK